MRFLLISLLLLIAVPGLAEDTMKTPSEGIAVVELFTSQGCSSCPPADKELSTLDQIGRKEGKPVYCLAYHVDYWDGLGWPDPFSSPDWSARQYAYDRALKSRTYTPQMVVNGSTEFVGSSDAQARQAITKALQSPAPVAISATRTADGFAVTFNQKPGSGAVLHVALVESNLVTKIGSGENGGRTLRNDCVVRRFVSVAADSKELQVKAFDEDTPAAQRKLEAVLFVSDGDAGRVLGATRIAADR